MALWLLITVLDEEIHESQLYIYNRNRWMSVASFAPRGSFVFALTLFRFNESAQLSSRYLKFDLPKLLSAAVAAVYDTGARYCTYVFSTFIIRSLIADSDSWHQTPQVS